MMIQKSRAVLQNFADATQYEWLETNGLGGWSGSTIIGAHNRRYHGLLAAAIQPPAGRMMLLSKLDETIVTGNTRHELGTNRYGGNTIYPAGHHYLTHFSRGLFPEWTYDADGIVIRKTTGMLHGENTVVIWYEVIEAPEPFTMEWQPLVAARDYHALQKEGPQLHWDADFQDGLFHNRPDGQTDLYIHIPGATYQHEPCWYRQFHYGVEEYRGLDHTEDLLRHGIFSITLQRGDTLGIIISTDDPRGRDAGMLLSRERERRTSLMAAQPQDPWIRKLVLAADQFIVQRNEAAAGEAGATVIAGYHWFTDWGRDTMISLPGLTLSTGRFDDAKKILKAFLLYLDRGMLPNRFQDNGEPPEYNNVDGTLWYFIACYKYLQATGDKQFLLEEILPAFKEIIHWHLKGTRYNIHAGEDGLLNAGEAGQQLTWMDARIGNWVVTPRAGKPVEVQALWYNALMITVALLRMNDQPEVSDELAQLAAKTKENFAKLFWNSNAGCLYDVIAENGVPDATIRPNQLFAISLPFALIDDGQAAAVFKTVTRHLYTPVGLRSLPAGTEAYIPVYGGDQWHRDSAYHQGTVWSWLIGPYVDALIKTGGEKGKSKATKLIRQMLNHLDDACLGTVSEIFDADPPHHPRGCVAQAWGVAELLRVIREYNLVIPFRAKKKKTAIS